MENVKIFPFSVLSTLFRIALKRSGDNTKEEFIKAYYLSIVYKGGQLYSEKYYTTLEKDNKIHTFPEIM